MQRCHPTTKEYQNVTAVKQNDTTSMNPAHAALLYIKWLSVKDWWFIQDKGAVLVQQPVLQEPLPSSSNCMDRDSSTHSPPEVTSSELGWGTLAGQCGEACIAAAALAIPVLWRNRGLNFQGCRSVPSTLQVKEKEINLTMPASSEYILGGGEQPPFSIEVFGLLSHLLWSSICLPGQQAGFFGSWVDDALASYLYRKLGYGHWEST